MIKITSLHFAFMLLSLGWGLFTFGVFYLFGIGVACMAASVPFVAVSLVLFRGAVAEGQANE
jgi:hypothetical protein